MSFDAETIAALSAKDLDSLESNVRRLIVSGTAAQVTEAARVLPLIEAERLRRPPAAKKALRKTGAPKKGAGKSSP